MSETTKRTEVEMDAPPETVRAALIRVDAALHPQGGRSIVPEVMGDMTLACEWLQAQEARHPSPDWYEATYERTRRILFAADANRGQS